MTKDQNRINFHEMTKVIDKFKNQFDNIKIEFVKEGCNQLGKEFKGIRINPEISIKRKQPKNKRVSK